MNAARERYERIGAGTDHLLFAILWLLAFLSLPSLYAAETEAPRLAIVSQNEARDLAALMTERLAKNPSFVLIERDDLAKAGDEWKLSEMARADGQMLGKLIGADGLLFLSREGEQFRARLTAVTLGFAVFDLVFHREATPEDVLQKLESRIRRLTGKLTLTPEHAIPLSVLNLRADSLSEQGAEIERLATMLLESRLSEAAEIVILERREAGALAFEHALNGERTSILRGAFLVDGSLRLSSGGDSVIASVRVRSPKEEASFEMAGSLKDLPGFANRLAGKIARITKTSLPPSQASSKGEAREYLLEGVWAHRCRLARSALAALDSAEMLGETASDLLALRIPVLCMLATGSSKITYVTTPVPDKADPDDDIAFLGRALEDLARYRADKGQSKLEILDSHQSFDGRTSHLEEISVVSSLRMLAMLESTSNPRAADFRTSIRSALGYAPFEGQLPKDWSTAIEFAGLLSTSREEEIEYYRRLSTTFPAAAYEAWRLQLVLRPETFCARFIPSVEERKAAYFRFWKELLRDPVGKPAALLHLAQKASPDERTAACKNLYRELWEQRQELLRANRIVYLLKYAFKLETENGVKEADHRLISTLHFVLQNETKTNGATEGIWCPELFPRKEARKLQRALKEFQSRVIAAGGSDGYFQRMNQKLLQQFPDLAEPSVALPPLKITSFWYPKNAPALFLTGTYDFKVENDYVLLTGIHSRQVRTFELRLPGFETREIVSPLTQTPEDTLHTKDSLLLLCKPNDGNPKAVIMRYDRARGGWSEHEVPVKTQRIFRVHDKVYLSLGNSVTDPDAGGIALFEEVTGEVTVLASCRRKPARNQFDDCPKYRVGAIFAGPSGRVCALIDYKVYEIKAEPGNWSLVSDTGVMRSATSTLGRTLLHGSTTHSNRLKAAILFDPARSQPEVWMGPVSSLKVRSGKEWIQPESPEWSNSFFWPAADKEAGEEIECSIRGDDLLCLVRNHSEGERARLIYYRRGKTDPIHIPLRFEMQPDALNALKSVLSEKVNTFDVISKPHEHPHILEMQVASSGLCFRALHHGFWFLPFAELDAYLKALDAD